MRREINIFFDMDGVLCEYNPNDSVEKMMQPGYFSSREEIVMMTSVLRKLKNDNRFHVRILTAVFPEEHNRREKLEWLKKLGLEDVEVCFTPVGESKLSYIDTKGVNILIDDYTLNLLSWQSGGSDFIGIKFYNSINGRHGTWKKLNGESINCHMKSEEAAWRISRAALSAA